MKIELYISDQTYNEDESFKKYFEALQLMVNRMDQSHYKYGNMDFKYPHSAKAIDNIYPRTAEYIATGNTEFLLDAANFTIIEAILPSHDKAHFESTDEKHPRAKIIYDENS